AADQTIQSGRSVRDSSVNRTDIQHPNFRTLHEYARLASCGFSVRPSRL
ncbi:hypothetical protein, partial [Pseudomonas fluorescens]